jgi:CHAT domain-containing protein/tetratricopeptide (TPR) repeat protein
MINQEVLQGLAKIWKKLKNSRFQISPDEFAETAQWITQQMPILMGGAFDNVNLLKTAAPGVTLPLVRAEAREYKLVFYLFLKVLRRLGMGESEWAYMCRMFIGACYYGLQNFEYAVRYLDPVLPYLRQREPPGDESFLGLTFAWASSSIAIGKGLDILTVVEDTVARARAAGCKSEFVARLEEIPAALYAPLGETERARRLLEKALDDAALHHGRESREYVEASMRLALAVDLLTGDLVRATARLGEAMFLVESNRGLFWAESVRFMVMNLAGEIAARTGDSAGEARYLKEAVLGRRQHATKRDPPLVAITLRLAQCLVQLKQWDEALRYLTDLSPDHSGIGWMIPEHQVRYVESYLACCSAIGRSVDSEILDLVVEQQATVIRQLLGWSGEDLLLQACEKLWHTIGLQLVYSLRKHNGANLGRMLQRVVEFKGIVAESLCISREHRWAELYPECRESLRRLGDLRRKLQGSYRDVFKGIPETEAERTANRMRSEKDALEETLRRRIPEMEFASPSTDQLADSLERLEPDSVLLEFVHIPPKFKPFDGFAVFLLPAGRPDLLELVGLRDSATILEAIGQFRQAMAPPMDAKRAVAPDYQVLWERVWAPLESALGRLREALPGRICRRLLVSLDDALTWLPLQILRNPEWPEERFLIDEYEISYLTTSRDIVTTSGNKPKRGIRPVAMGLCEFGARDSAEQSTPSGGLFPPLPNAERESIEVGAQLDAEVWTGVEEVTKERVLGRLGHVDAAARQLNYRAPLVVHIASHGFSLTENDEGYALHLDDSQETQRVRLALQRSGLAVSGAENSAARLRSAEVLPNGLPGILNAYEISGLDLRDNELVVLSACETGMGVVSSGEGVFGLQRAFFIAGTRTLVMPLWAVDDVAPSLLMQAFYARLKRGESRSSALRMAQLHVRKKLRRPASWGGFVCQGSPLPVPGITP